MQFLPFTVGYLFSPLYQMKMFRYLQHFLNLSFYTSIDETSSYFQKLPSHLNYNFKFFYFSNAEN